jgi:uncharacterized protein (UPF0333 family)
MRYVKRPLKILVLLAVTIAIGYVAIRIISASSSVDRLSLGFLVGLFSLFFIFSLLAAVLLYSGTTIRDIGQMLNHKRSIIFRNL